MNKTLKDMLIGVILGDAHIKQESSEVENDLEMDNLDLFDF
jgi:hypothetical protein